MFSVALAMLRRDLALALRSGIAFWQPLLVFLIFGTLVALSIGADRAALIDLAPAVLSMSTLLAVLLSLPALYGGDAEDGSLELLRSSSVPLSYLMLLRALNHTLIAGLPLLLATPLLGGMLGVDGSKLPTVAATIALMLPTLCLTGAAVSALTLGASHGGSLLALLALPLYVPTLIFGSATLSASLTGAALGSAPWLLLAAALFALATCPFAAALGLDAQTR